MCSILIITACILTRRCYIVVVASLKIPRAPKWFFVVFLLFECCAFLLNPHTSFFSLSILSLTCSLAFGFHHGAGCSVTSSKYDMISRAGSCSFCIVNREEDYKKEKRKREKRAERGKYEREVRWFLRKWFFFFLTSVVDDVVWYWGWLELGTMDTVHSWFSDMDS